MRMIQRATGPSRLVQAVARWAITLGAAGTIVGTTAMYGVLLGKEAADNRRGMLMLSAILLSLAFVLAPFVRRAFGNRPVAGKAAAPAQRTLLEELREAPHGEAATEPTSELEVAPATPLTEVPAATSLATRLLAGVYVMFAAALLVILWTLQTM